MGFWSGIKHALNSTLGTSGFSPLDKIVKDSTHIVDENVKRLRGGVQTFTSNGTFTVPEGVTKILVTACAGGQAGYDGINNGGPGGNGGDWIFKEPYSVISGQSIQITVGKGGASNGSVGTSTVIGYLVTLPCPGNRGGKGGKVGETSSSGERGGDGFASGGIGGLGTSRRGGSGGGGGSLGCGGTGDDNTYKNGVLGGGGGGYAGGGYGKGGDGIVIIEW